MSSNEDLAEKRERIRAAKYEEALEMERARLTENHASLGKLCAAVRAGDRESMLQLIEVTSETLHAFDLLPEELRGKLADGLNEIVRVLSQSPDFERGKLSTVKKRKEATTIWLTAWQVENLRYYQGLSLEEAEASVAETFQVKQDLVHKRWKRGHIEAKESFKMLDAIYEVTGFVPLSRRTKKKVR